MTPTTRHARTPLLARRYGEALRAGEPGAAEEVVEEALGAGLSVPAVQSRVIAPAMYWIGELWERGALTVAEEHLARGLSNPPLPRPFPTTRENGRTPVWNPVNLAPFRWRPLP